ncbi:hypothetical protein D3C85_1174030 [compost metagenome]
MRFLPHRIILVVFARTLKGKSALEPVQLCFVKVFACSVDHGQCVGHGIQSCLWLPAAPVSRGQQGQKIRTSKLCSGCLVIGDTLGYLSDTLVNVSLLGASPTLQNSPPRQIKRKPLFE